jgi:hypothetical protein
MTGKLEQQYRIALETLGAAALARNRERTELAWERLDRIHATIEAQALEERELRLTTWEEDAQVTPVRHWRYQAAVYGEQDINYA